MKGAEIKAAYVRELKELVLIRRYSGTGTGKTKIDATCRARVAYAQSSELAGEVKQGDQLVIVYADDVEKHYQTGAPTGLTGPITPDDKCVIGGKVCTIVNPKRKTGMDGVLAAYALHVRGI